MKTRNTSRKNRKVEAAERAAEDNDTVALAEHEAKPARRGRKAKAQAPEGMAVHLDPADLNARLAAYLYDEELWHGSPGQRPTHELTPRGQQAHERRAAARSGGDDDC